MPNDTLKNILTRFSVTLACAFSLPCNANVMDPILLDIPQQSLARSIIKLGKAANISIVVSSKLVRGHRSQAIKGRYSAQQALELLLGDSGLSYEVVDEHVIALIPLKVKKEEEQGPIGPEEMVVVGRQVTGSLLDRSDLWGASPVNTITQHDLQISGSQSIGEYLKFIPAVSGNSTSTAISNGGDGTATVTLRGLPSNNTLVLLNGKRISTDGLKGDSADLNSIPSAAIERVEILKDGASAIYGTDAIAGVVNIITKREFDGIEIEQYYGTTYKSDVETSSTHLLWGKSSERASLLISAEHFDQNGLFSRERSLSSTADGRSYGGEDKRSSATPNSRITLSDGRVVILREGENGDSVNDFREATEEDRFNFLSQTSTISPSKRQNIFISHQWRFNNNTTLNVDANFNKTEAHITFAASPIFSAFEDPNILVASDNPYNPFGEEISDIRRRVVESPLREQTNTSITRRFAIGLDGHSGKLEWAIHSYWNNTRAREDFRNLLSHQRVARALGPADQCQGASIDGCVPLNLFGPTGSIDAEQLNYIEAHSENHGQSEIKGVHGNIHFPIQQDSFNPAQLALGVDFRQEDLESEPGGNTENTIAATRPVKLQGSRDVAEAFIEAQIPLVKQRSLIQSLDLELALRHSHYSDFGDNTSPKIGLRYRPINSWLFRSTYSEGFRAPSLGELYKGHVQTQLPLQDPCIYEENVGLLPGCPMQSDPSRTQILTTFAGEPELDPETSRNTTFGIVWTPENISNLSISLDYFNIRQKNIVDANAQYILDENAHTLAFPDFVDRDNNGNITRLFSPFINVGERNLSGVDTTIRYSFTLEQKGNLTYSFNSTYLDEYAYKLDTESPYQILAGRFEDAANEGSGTLPRWKANTGMLWTYGNLEFSYSINFISSVQEVVPFSQGRIRKLGSWTSHDTQINYRLGHNESFTLTIGADNLWNRKPPFATSAFNDNYDARTYDIKGTFVYGRVRYSF